MKLNRKARARLYRNRQRREYRRTFSAAVKHSQAHLAMQRTWATAATLMRELTSAANKESSQ